MKFFPPKKPNDLSDPEWSAILRRHQGADGAYVCANLLTGECSDPCGTPRDDGLIHLDRDHTQSREKGGGSHGDCGGVETASVAFKVRWLNIFTYIDSLRFVRPLTE